MSEFSVRPKSSSLKVWEGHPRVSLGISLGNSNERGERLRSIVDWINGNFGEAIIDLSDTLYRWNEQTPDGRPAADSEARSRARGDQWLEQNREVLSGLTIPHRVVRWDYWRNHPEFGATENSLRTLYQNGETSYLKGQSSFTPPSPGGDEAFYKPINRDVEKFLQRQKRNGFPVDDTVTDNCRSFLFEELAGHTLLFRTFPGTVKAYPGDDLEAATAIRTGKVPGAPIGLQGIPFVALRIESSPSLCKALQKPLTAMPALKTLV